MHAQTGTADTLQVYAFIVDGDTIPGGRMLDVNVRTVMKEHWRRYWNRMDPIKKCRLCNLSLCQSRRQNNE